MKILLVEDDSILAENLAEAIAAQLYVIDVVGDGETAWDYVQSFHYDLILLDVNLPKLNGVSLCRKLRQQGFDKPILMLTARDTSDDKVLGLDAGADDYVIKPFDLPELLARIRALLRRGNSRSPILEWDDLCLDPRTYQVTYAQQTLSLTPKEYSILELLMRNGQRVLSRRLILEQVWAFEDMPSEDTVKAHINSLRSKLKAVNAPPNLIGTVRGIGYCLNVTS
ncbi:MAG: response regulator transcription factor [Prochloraceae cyanobacterium]